MTNFEATFTEISNWQKNIHYSTGGTRSKYIALDPLKNEEYFFKGCKETIEGEIRYPTEFWSEIVSSKIGQLLGFEMLDYNIAYDVNHKQKMGCLSKSMVLHSQNKLTEGITYLTGFNSNYNPQKDKNKYTFQFINSALKEFNLDNYLDNIIEIIIFDSVIGNSDRHQENWGIITYYKTALENIDDNLSKEKGMMSRLSYKLTKSVNELLISKHDSKSKWSKSLLKAQSEIAPNKFAPIYDSGCCLGREHSEDKVEKIINDNQMLEAYIKKGEAEIHWEGFEKKRKHFELVELLIQNYPDQTNKYINRVKEKFNAQKIKEIIENIDSNLPNELINFKLSDSRKKLMFKLITLRIEKLMTFL